MLSPVSPGVSTAAGIASTVSIPVELVTPIVIGSSWTQRYGITIVLERSRPSVCGPSTSNGNDRVVDRDRGDREVVLLRVRDADLDLARLELDPADVEQVGLRRVRADQADERRAGRDEGPDDGREQHHRDERPEAPARLDPPRRPSLHQSTTSKKPIQPRSVNSDWCAWNMNRPVFVKSISSTPRCPWHCITVSVYSQLSPVPVGW